MTDKEKAKEYAYEKCKECYMCDYAEPEKEAEEIYNSCPWWTKRKEGYLDGLAEGKPKWHDLRKDPNDLPETSNWCHCVSIPVLNQDGIKVMYNYIRETWHFARRRNQYETCKVIAWCELPEFEG